MIINTFINFLSKTNSIFIECCFPRGESSWLAVQWLVSTAHPQFGPVALPLGSFTTFQDLGVKMKPSPIHCEFVVVLCSVVSWKL